MTLLLRVLNQIKNRLFSITLLQVCVSAYKARTTNAMKRFVNTYEFLNHFKEHLKRIKWKFPTVIHSFNHSLTNTRCCTHYSRIQFFHFVKAKIGSTLILISHLTVSMWFNVFQWMFFSPKCSASCVSVCLWL